jgi:hypothetical protein
MNWNSSRVRSIGSAVAAKGIHETELRDPSRAYGGELFGHERGAFTGAIAQKTGRLCITTVFIIGIGHRLADGPLYSVFEFL